MLKFDGSKKDLKELRKREVLVTRTRSNYDLRKFELFLSTAPAWGHVYPAGSCDNKDWFKVCITRKQAEELVKQLSEMLN